MGVAVLQHFPQPPDKTVQQAVEILHRRILNLGASHTGQFLVDCETYFSTPSSGHQPPKTLNVLHNSEQPATVFSVLENAGKTVVFTSDTLFDLLLIKLSNVYSKKFKIESKGSRFEVGDFLVKLGVVSAGGSVKGILVEVEYLPCNVLQNCWGLISEFMQSFLGAHSPSQIPPMLKGKNEFYTPIDTTRQYLDHFNNLRKAGVLQQQRQ